LELANLEAKLGFRSYFNFVPEKYKNSNSTFREIRKLGCDIGVHDLKHDGKLFISRRIFERRAAKINSYLIKWNTKGFTAGSMLRNLDWMKALNISYSTSTFDTDPFEPQQDAAKSIFPYWVGNGHYYSGFLEFPYTLPQDHLLFVILKEKNIDIWKKKLDWIAEKGGMALLNTHTDYMNFDKRKNNSEEYSVELYTEFLEYIKNMYSDQYLNVLPKDIARYLQKNFKQD